MSNSFKMARHPKIAFLIALLTSLLSIIPTTLGNGINPVEETRGILERLERSLSSSRISEDLKLKFLDSDEPLSERASIIIEFTGGNSQAIKDFKNDPFATRATATKGERISNLVDKLRENAANSQDQVIKFLKSEGADPLPLWAANEIYVKNADSRVISEIAFRFGSVAKIRPVGRVRPPKPKPSRPSRFPPLSRDVPQPIQQVDGRCRDIKCLGEGVVVAIIDTGVLWTHVELKDNYRHDFGWYDPVNGTEFPTFSLDHGTHVTGIIVGKTKGVAPKAQWIACLAFRTDFDEEVYLKACGEWALCPSRWNDTNDRDCSKAPDIINNSWGLDPDEQLTIPRDFYYGIQEAWNAAGIISFFAGGNAGPYCTSIDPPASYDISFAIAAVDNTSTAAYWSSRGPVLHEFGSNTDSDSNLGTCKRQCSGEDNHGWRSYKAGGQEVCTLTKPDLSAPGVNINSSYVETNTSYIEFSGTSMATPMVAGVAALMVCANNRAGGTKLDQASATQILKATARQDRINLVEGNGSDGPNNPARTSNLLCNAALGNGICGFPNNIYGHGEVWACEAVKSVRKRL